MQTAADNTTVKTVDLDIDSWLGAPGADSIVTPDDDAKPNMFTGNKDVDINKLVDQRTPAAGPTDTPLEGAAGDDDERGRGGQLVDSPGYDADAGFAGHVPVEQDHVVGLTLQRGL